MLAINEQNHFQDYFQGLSKPWITVQIPFQYPIGLLIASSRPESKICIWIAVTSIIKHETTSSEIMLYLSEFDGIIFHRDAFVPKAEWESWRSILILIFALLQGLLSHFPASIPKWKFKKNFISNLRVTGLSELQDS